MADQKIKIRIPEKYRSQAVLLFIFLPVLILIVANIIWLFFMPESTHTNHQMTLMVGVVLLMVPIPFLLYSALKTRSFALSIIKFTERIYNENFSSAQMLVQRDVQLASVNDTLTRLNQELNEVGKVLVRRDRDLTTANTRLEEVDSVKSEFVSVAAHQLRTPLTGIKWSFQALLDGSLGELNFEQQKIADDGLKTTIRLGTLVNDLLDVAKIEEGRYGMIFKHVSITPLVKRAYDAFARTALKKGIKYSLELPDKEPPLLHVDGEKILIVLDNLIDNAIKYTPAGKKVTIKISQDEKHVKIDIIDNGIGVPRDQYHLVSTRFFRASNAMLFQTTGSGLGLYVVRNIVDRHGGTLTIKSTENEGSVFSIALPIPR